MFVHDIQCGAELAETVPVLLSVDNPILSLQAHRALSEYLRAGGRVLAVGAFAERDEDGNSLPPLPDGIIRLPDDATGAPVTVTHQTSTDRGAATWSAKVHPLPVERIEQQMEQIALLRPVQVTSHEGSGWAKGAECLSLTDGVNLAVVLLHRADSAREVLVSLHPRLPGANGARYRLRDAITGQVLSPILPACVSLEPYGTRLLVMEHEVSPQECEAEITQAQQAIARWREKGVDVAPFELWLQSAITHLKAQRFVKAFALARNITGSLAIQPIVRRTGETLQVKAAIWQPNGRPARDAQVRVRLVPAAFQWHKMNPDGKGVFSVTLNPPRLYSPMKTKYTPVTQGLMLILEARLGGLTGGGTVCVSLTQAGFV